MHRGQVSCFRERVLLICEIAVWLSKVELLTDAGSTEMECASTIVDRAHGLEIRGSGDERAYRRATSQSFPHGDRVGRGDEQKTQSNERNHRSGAVEKKLHGPFILTHDPQKDVELQRDTARLRA